MPSDPVEPVADDEAVRLLLTAVDALPAAERTLVLSWLVRRGLGPTPPALLSLGSALGGPPWPGSSLGVGFASVARRGGEQQMVPVRFPVEQHAALRGWCEANGWSMATVVRGLVEHFLSEQQQGAR